MMPRFFVIYKYAHTHTYLVLNRWHAFLVTHGNKAKSSASASEKKKEEKDKEKEILFLCMYVCMLYFFFKFFCMRCHVRRDDTNIF